MKKSNKSLILNVISLIVLILLLNVDSLVITNINYLIIFRALYFLIFVVLFISSILKGKQTSKINKIFEPIISKYNEFPKNYQVFISVSISIGLLIFFGVAVGILIYIY